MNEAELKREYDRRLQRINDIYEHALAAENKRHFAREQQIVHARKVRLDQARHWRNVTEPTRPRRRK